jgi:hypothetical protein
MWKRFGEIVVERHGVRQSAVDDCLQEKRIGDTLRLGERLVRAHALSERQLVIALAFQFQIPIALELCRYDVPEALLHAIPAAIAKHSLVFPISVTRTPNGSELVLAMADPSDIGLMFEIERFTGCTVFPVISPAAELRRAILRHYSLRRENEHERADGVLLIEQADESGSGVIPLEAGTRQLTTEAG